MKHLSHRSAYPLSLRVIITTLLAIFTLTAPAQGTFLYDQESSIDETSLFSGVGIQFYGSIGQSFTPSLTNVNFVRLRFFDTAPGNSIGATLVVRLHSGAIDGTVIGSSDPLPLPDGFVGGANFFFPSGVALTPSATYFLEASVQTGDLWGATTLGGNTYPNGNFYGGTGSFFADDLWFREGIVVPEPSAIALFLGSGLSLWFLRRKKQQ